MFASRTKSPYAKPPPKVLLALVTVALMPFPVVLADFSPRIGVYERATVVFPLELAMAGLVLACARPVIRAVRQRRLGLGAAGWLALTGSSALAWLAHPSGRGLLVLLHFAAAVALAHVVTLAWRARWPLAAFVGAVAIGETVLALAQKLSGRSLGLHALGEPARPLYGFGSARAPQGTMVHIYVLAALALVSAGMLAATALTSSRPARWTVAALVAVAPVGFTYSRAAALGLILLLAALCTAAGCGATASARRRAGALVVALGLGAGVPAVVWHDGWAARASQTTWATSEADFTTDRGTLTAEALHLIKTNPVVGVGPGRYVIALRARDGVERSARVKVFKPVHDMPLLAWAEDGLMAFAIMAVLFGGLGWRAWRTGPLAVGAFLALLPLCLLDHLLYTFPQGVVLTGLWLGTLDGLARTPRLTGWASPRRRSLVSGDSVPPAARLAVRA